MFRYIGTARRRGSPITITIDGATTSVPSGETLAAALLHSGHLDCRTTAVSTQPRGPFCMMGVCFECLVIVDGQPNQQACMTSVREGMRVERQQGGGGILFHTGSQPGGNDGSEL